MRVRVCCVRERVFAVAGSRTQMRAFSFTMQFRRRVCVNVEVCLRVSRLRVGEIFSSLARRRLVVFALIFNGRSPRFARHQLVAGRLCTAATMTTTTGDDRMDGCCCLCSRLALAECTRGTCT